MDLPVLGLRRSKWDNRGCHFPDNCLASMLPKVGDGRDAAGWVFMGGVVA